MTVSASIAEPLFYSRPVVQKPISHFGRLWRWTKETAHLITSFFLRLFRCCPFHRIPPYTRLAEATLPRVDDRLLSTPLYNLGKTCYMNSALQAFAHSDAFNQILTTRQETDTATVCALRNHLASLVSIMRGKNSSEEITYEDLHALFNLSRSCGWRADSELCEEDSSEYLAWLVHILGGEIIKGAEIPLSTNGSPFLYFVAPGRQPFVDRFTISEGRTYELKAALLHHGTSEAGHYSALLASHLFGKTYLIHYNDSQPPQFDQAINDQETLFTRLLHERATYYLCTTQ